MNKLVDQAIRTEMWGLAMGQLYWPRKAPNIVDGHEALYDFAAKTIGKDTPVLYLEFGVASGRSIIGMAKRFTHPQSRFFGFDSFAGLPESWLHLPQGAFSSGGKPPETQDKRIAFVTGWFQNTVHPFLSDFAGAGDKVVLIHFDADLYSSTSFLLSSLWPHFPSYYFMMDDFVHDDAIALYDFSSAYPVEIAFHAQTRGAGAGPNPDQVFGHMRRVPFSLPSDPGPVAPSPDGAAVTLGPEWTLAANGNLAEVLGDGWSAPEPWGIWGVGNAHVMDITKPATAKQDIELEFDVEAVLTAARSQQVVEVSVGGQTLEIWTFTIAMNRAARGLRVPADLAKPRSAQDGSFSIEFRPRSVKSVAEITPGSDDTRTLGLGLHAMRLREE
jgi:hypothetical protein